MLFSLTPNNSLEKFIKHILFLIEFTSVTRLDKLLLQKNASEIGVDSLNMFKLGVSFGDQEIFCLPQIHAKCAPKRNKNPSIEEDTDVQESLCKYIHCMQATKINNLEYFPKCGNYTRSVKSCIAPALRQGIEALLCGRIIDLLTGVACLNVSKDQIGAVFVQKTTLHGKLSEGNVCLYIRRRLNCN